MTDKTISLRGYDDSPYLKEMADGIITRRFASVDEAAKAVLDEEAGSNVDRLRRKFREQNWYERGLNDYVEAEINRRADEAPATDAQPAFVTATGRPMNKVEVLFEKTMRKLTNEFTPTATMAFFGAGLTAALAAVTMRPMSIVPVLTASFLVSLLGMMIWAHRAASKATPVQACLHIASMSVLFVAMAVGLAIAVPDPSFKAGSLPGTAVIAFAGLVLSNYLCELVMAYGRRSGRAKSPEIFALAVAIVVSISAFGWFPVVNDLSYAVKRAEQGMEAYERVAEVYKQLRKDHPDIDLEPLMEAQRQIVKDAARRPTWAGE
ncbi:hypothetical protein OIU34_23050 [Pararhizobium sp. BT-229]|uniref:hypothetical protein n=1 Tax=Pararhizobium sp. BT-229 TaxID=2986923 RepID=UPI0021F77D2B|nr:hypothetical protein [Pararhizobium sp. BT-229]MCV9964773.1 hypothetical protein [Pararhizobium sp. BT-229]